MKTRIVLTLALIAVLAESVFAAPTPAEGDKFYTIYDVMVNDIVQGPPGIAIAVGGVAYGVCSFSVMRSFLPLVRLLARCLCFFRPLSPLA
jgi:hypothetical protein